MAMRVVDDEEGSIMARAARVMAMATKVVGNKKGDTMARAARAMEMATRVAGNCGPKIECMMMLQVLFVKICHYHNYN